MPSMRVFSPANVICRAGAAFAFFGAAIGCTGVAHAAISGEFVKGPYSQSVTSTSAEIRVEVSPPAPVTLELDGDGGDAGAPIVQADESAFHVFMLDKLTPSKRYVFTVTSGSARKVAEVTTAPPDETLSPISFLIYGDNRTDDSSHAAIVKSMTADASDFLIHTGDFVERGDVPSLWKRFFEIESPLLTTRTLFATIGNHELVDKDATLYLRYFGPVNAANATASALHRTFRWGFLRFFVISGLGDVAVEKAWLDSELSKSDHETNIAFRIAVTHFGPWSSGPHGDNKRLHNTGIVDSLVAHHIDLVVSGHDHIYERGDANGVAYVVSGGGGAPLYEQAGKRESTRSFESTRHFVEVHASPQALSMKAIRADGSLIESCALVKSAGWDCDKKTASSNAASRANGKSADQKNDASSSRSKSSCACDLVGAWNGESPVNSRLAAMLSAALSLFVLLLRRRVTYARR